MKRYLLFAGDDYYPQGGFIDFKKDFDTFKEALDYYDKEVLIPDSCDWAHIYDLEERRIEKCCHRGEWRLLCCEHD
jgi:hypothetical protein